MSNVSISHKIPTFCLLRDNIYCFNICFFYKGHDSCHLHLKHSSPNAYITTYFLDLHIPPSCKATFATTTWTLTHESLSILNFTSLKLTFLLICLFSSVMEKQRCTLQNLTPSLNRALCNCSCILSIFIALLLLLVTSFQ